VTNKRATSGCREPHLRRFGITLSLLLVSGCSWPGLAKPEEPPVPAEREKSFGPLYARNCAGCHGANGTMGPAPPLNDPLFRALVPQKELESVITKGRPGTLMPAFARDNGGTLTPVQIQVLVSQIKGIPYTVITREGEVKVLQGIPDVALEWGEPERAPANAPPYLIPEAKADGTGDKERGETVFALACSRCHGDRGEGGENGKNRINDPNFLALLSDQALRRIAITGRPDFDMPNYAGKKERSAHFHPLTSRDVTDLVALLGYWRQGGAVNK
jgi:mono/diheme cytochrome c family protein